MHDLIGGRATWTALGLPTEGTVGDRDRISGHLQPVVSVPFWLSLGDVRDWAGPLVAVTNDEQIVVGSLDPDARSLPPGTPVGQAMNPSPNTIRPELRVHEVATRLRDDELDHVLVTTVSGVLLGLVERDRLPG